MHTLLSSHTNYHHLLASFPCLKRERERERGDFWGLEGVASPSLSPYGGPRLDPFRGHTYAPIEPREPWVHDGGGARNLPCV
jgi:hypothetical protein